MSFFVFLFFLLYFVSSPTTPYLSLSARFFPTCNTKSLFLVHLNSHSSVAFSFHDFLSTSNAPFFHLCTWSQWMTWSYCLIVLLCEKCCWKVTSERVVRRRGRYSSVLTRLPVSAYLHYRLATSLSPNWPITKYIINNNFYEYTAISISSYEIIPCTVHVYLNE